MRSSFISISLLLLTGCATAPVETGLQATVRTTVRSVVLDDGRSVERSQNIRHTLTRLQARQPYVGKPVNLLTLRSELVAELDQLVLSDKERADTIALLNDLAAAFDPPGQTADGAPNAIPVHEVLSLILMEIPTH